MCVGRGWGDKTPLALTPRLRGAYFGISFYAKK